jgi:hypothetical protein
MLQSKLAYSLDPQYLEGLAAQYRQDYLNAEPFPHIVALLLAVWESV